MKNKTTRLRFEEEELANKPVARAAKKAERAADKADAAKARLPTKNKLKHEKDKAADRKEQLRFGKKDNSKDADSSQKTSGQANKKAVPDRKKPASKKGGKQKAGTAGVNEHLRFDDSAVDVVSPGSRISRTASHAVTGTLAGRVHHEIAENEDDNVGVQAAHQSEEFAEGAARTVSNVRYGHKLKAYQKAARLDRKADKANVEALYQQAVTDNPEIASNPISRWKQRQEIKKQYYAAKAAQGAASGSKAASGAAKGTEKTAQGAKTLLERLKEFAVRHTHAMIIILVFALLFLMISGAFSSCSAVVQGGTSSLLGTSFTATDEDITGTNEDYKALEAALKNEIDNIESTHPGYDEYRYQLDEINHNPYELTAYLTVLFEDYTRAEVQETLQALFDRQYTLTLEEEVEVRTRTETRTHTVTDPETGETSEEEYEVEVEYNYYILNVTLRNNGLGTAIATSGLTEDQQERYNILLQTQGNRPYLFEDDIYATPTGPYTDYDIPGEALTDEKFANMIHEAEKYLGFPYVWGGSSPSTSFDCSGFVCWVINNCGNGWNVGRTTANGLMSSCDIIPASEAQPGDLIFFQGTYDTAGASHVGIYVGGGMMIHCGNPISYASIETSYWQSHFYAYGRIR